jgi:hypothetical protein
MMLQFYRRNLSRLSRGSMKKRDRLALYYVMSVAVLSLVVAGCASAPNTPPTPNTTNPHPPSNVNLSGYPLAFRQGYADGCASERGRTQKDEKRFKSDLQYRQGWEDGFSICAKR